MDNIENKDWQSLRDWHIENPRKYFYQIEGEYYKDTISRLLIALAEVTEERDRAWDIALAGKNSNPNFSFIPIHESKKSSIPMSDIYIEPTDPFKIQIQTFL
jgi:hypothetical protein